MIPVFLEAALRSCVAGMAVAVGLRLFRVHNVLAQKAAWGLVLVSALAMPLLLPITAKWHLAPANLQVVLPAHPMTLLEELQERMMSRGGIERKVQRPTAAIPQSDSPKAREAAAPEQKAADGAGKQGSGTAEAARGAKQVESARGNQSLQAVSSQAIVEYASQVSPSIRNIAISPSDVVLALYCAVAALLFLRLALGLWTTVRLWRAAKPVAAAELGHDAASRASRQRRCRLARHHRLCCPAAGELPLLEQREAAHRARSRTLPYSPGRFLSPGAGQPLCLAGVVQPSRMVDQTRACGAC